MEGVQERRRIEPLARPLDATVRLPGSKSITNRALVCAALAHGRSTLRGALFSDDTEAMVECLRSLGFSITADAARAELVIVGAGGQVPASHAQIDVRLSGTTARFVTPLLALGHGTYVVEAQGRMRERPMDDLLRVLSELGAVVEHAEGRAVFPFTVHASGLRGGEVEVAGDASSQFLSGLLLSGPAMRDGLGVRVTTPLVSEPYVQLTLAVLRSFGAVAGDPEHLRYCVEPGSLAACDYAIEPDASAASYFFAAAALCGGRVRVEGLGADALQGDVRFVDVLERMGARVVREPHAIEVSGTGELVGIDVDMSDISDTAQTVAAIAPFARGRTRVTGIGFIRRKETDRIGAVVAELRRCGIEASEQPDGFTIEPGVPHAAAFSTYGDHRMAMAFSLIGLRVPGIEIRDPGCVAKTFPGFFDAIEGLGVGVGSRGHLPGAVTSSRC